MIFKIFNSLKYRIFDRIQQKYILHLFSSFGSNITIGEDFKAFGYSNVSVGSHVYIGPGARFLSTDATITIGNYCMFGPEVMIITGDHRSDVVGEYMYNVKEKLSSNDLPVKIENDVWVGARATILKGTIVGEGSIVAAGAIVTGIIPPYSIYYSRNKIVPRFDELQIKEHIEKLNEKYPKKP